MSDGELEALAAEGSQLTPVAKETLCAEISRRRLPIPVRDAPEPPAVVEDLDPAGLELVVATRLWDASEAHRAKAYLNDSGIPCFFGPESVEDPNGAGLNFDRGVDLKVCEADAARARRGLAKLLPPPPGADAPYNLVCPRCKSPEIVFEGLDAEPKDAAEGAAAGSSFNWRCDACGHGWKDDGVEQQA